MSTIISRHLPRGTKSYAHRWFFTAASLYAALVIPLAMLARHGYGPAALATSTGHAFEMLFGFALALIAGYMLGPMPVRHLVWLMACWLLARVVDLVGQFDDYHLYRYLLDESVTLFALLMLFIGGRTLAPAAAGEFYRQGINLEARVQPLIESGLIITVAAAFMLAPVAASLSGALLISSGILASIRLLRWQLWRCLARPDLICLGLGYAWLALGLMLLGWIKLSASTHFSTAVHAITVGALGTLSLNVMVRVTLLHVKRYPSCIPQIVIMTGLMSMAAITRIGADFSGQREILLATAALAWSSAFLLALFIQLNSYVKPPLNTAQSPLSKPDE